MEHGAEKVGEGRKDPEKSEVRKCRKERRAARERRGDILRE